MGTLADNMDPYRSAKLFYNALKEGPRLGDHGPRRGGPGRPTLGVPDRYAGKMGRGGELAKASKLFDTGGVWGAGDVRLQRPG